MASYLDVELELDNMITLCQRFKESISLLESHKISGDTLYKFYANEFEPDVSGHMVAIDEAMEFINED